MRVGTFDQTNDDGVLLLTADRASSRFVEKPKTKPMTDLLVDIYGPVRLVVRHLRHYFSDLIPTIFWRVPIAREVARPAILAT